MLIRAVRRDSEIQQKRALTQFTRRQNTEAAEKERVSTRRLRENTRQLRVREHMRKNTSQLREGEHEAAVRERERERD